MTSKKMTMAGRFAHIHSNEGRDEEWYEFIFDAAMALADNYDHGRRFNYFVFHFPDKSRLGIGQEIREI